VLDWLRERVDLVVVDPWAEQDDWNREAPNVDAVISRKGRIGREAIEASRGRLKIVARCGVGVDPSRVDLDAAKEGRVWVTNIPGVNAVSVAELVFGHMLNLARHLQDAHKAVKAGRWSDYVLYVGNELAGKTIGIVGFGNIGTRVAIRAKAFEMNFLVVDPYIPESHVTALGGRLVKLPELLTESDYITFHTPLTSETKGMVAAAELKQMKPSAFVINAARGGIVDEHDLYEALKAGTIAGAAIDAVEEEPLDREHPLLSLDNCFFTPHTGGGTFEASTRGEWGAAQEVIRVLQGEAPKNPVFAI